MHWTAIPSIVDASYAVICRIFCVRTRDQDDPHDDAHPEGENSAKRQKTSEYEAYVSGESSSGQVNVEEPGPSTSVTQDIMEEISLTIDEAKLKRWGSIVFNDDDIEERTSRWVNKRQKEPGRLKEDIYSNSKIVQVIKTYWELGHEHKFITKIVARRANDCIVSITEPDYKILNKNDIEDMYLLIVNNKVPDYVNTGLLWSLSVFIRSTMIWERVHDFQLGIESHQQKINLTTPTITFLRVEEYDVFSIVYEPVHGIIYTNSKKEKRVMRHSEIHKFCDATLRRTLEGLKSYNNDVKYGYVQKELTNDEVEFLKLFEEEIEVRLNYRDQMRRWEMYPLIPLPLPVAPKAVRDTYEVLYDAQNEVACIMLGSMSPDLKRALENYKAYDMIQELKTMFEEQAKQELFETVKAFHACKQEDRQPDDDQFVQNYNMHNTGKRIVKLYDMLKLHKKGIPKKAKTLAVLAIREGKIQKDKKKPQGAKGLRGSSKLKHGALSLYVGNGMRATVEAIGGLDLVLPSGLIIVLHKCHFAPTITWGIVSISRLVNNGYIHTFTNYGIYVSKDNVFYFNVIPRDGIYEINMHNLYPNVSSMFNVSNKRAKHALDSSYLWHCHLSHINKKRMDKLHNVRVAKTS
ncbi:hypothetical protein Tco_1132397 [Tanacetum coccineum]|uniref:GAG-pre-integrase domain-containing protein n=1 Tax=Tanacetum coccineum TaxID=301880 RepID=A0ABQ5JBR8_9ASTR